MTASIKIRDAAPADAELLSSLALRSKAHWGYSEELVRSFPEDSCRYSKSTFQVRIENENVLWPRIDT